MSEIARNSYARASQPVPVKQPESVRIGNTMQARAFKQDGAREYHERLMNDDRLFNQDKRILAGIFREFMKEQMS